MWREEPGCFEMLLAFYKENALDGNKSYRDFLLDLLECYEENKCDKNVACERPSSRKRRRISAEEQMDDVVDEVPVAPTRKPGPASKKKPPSNRTSVISDDESPTDVEDTTPPNGTNLIASSMPKAAAKESFSRREKVTHSGYRPVDCSKMYVRVPDPKPLPTLGQGRSSVALPSVTKLLSMQAKPSTTQRPIAPNPASILGNLNQLGELIGAKQNFGKGIPCILCSKSFETEEIYQRHDCFALCTPGPSNDVSVAIASSFACRCCTLSFPSDHRRLRHERNAHGLNV